QEPQAAASQGRARTRPEPARALVGRAGPSRLAVDRGREHARDGERQEPPRRDVQVLDEPRQPEPDGKPPGDTPVSADDEVPPEPAERPDAAHVTAGSGCGT